MKDLIEALTIFAKYQPETRWPTICQHDQLIICDVHRGGMSGEDIARVEDLGFVWDDSDDYWCSYRFGSA